MGSHALAAGLLLCYFTPELFPRQMGCLGAVFLSTVSLVLVFMEPAVNSWCSLGYGCLVGQGNF